MNELRVRVLGGFEIEGVPEATLGSRKARTMLKVLALARGRPVPVDTLVDTLWEDAPPAKPSDQLSVLASRARAALGAERLLRSDAGYALAIDWLDVDAMGMLVDEAERRLSSGATAAARAAVAAALALARGPLLPDEPNARFADIDRTAAERLAARAHHVGARAALAAGDPGAAAEFAERALDHDPFDEEALRLVMTARVQSGRPASALAVYARVRAQLAEELGVDPSPETEALHTSILLRTDDDTEQVVAERPTEPLPGRSNELARLDDAMRRRGLVIVDGEAGIGKSRLLTHWSARARGAGRSVLTGRCEELGRALPLQPVLDALASHLRGLDDLEVERVLSDDAALLGPLLGRSGTDRLPTGAVDQGTGQLLLFQALAAVLERLAPAVLVIDDIHLAATLTIEWLRFALTRLEGADVLLVVAARTDEVPSLPSAERVTLGPLELDAVADVVGPDRASELLARSGGNPLFLVELADAGTDELPASIRDAVAARVERAGPEVAATLRAAAVLAVEVDLDLLAGATGMSPVVVLDHLEVGARRGVLTEEGDGFRFSHALVRDALTAGTTASRRALLHREAGRTLAARPNADHLTVAVHARLGGDTALAAEHLVVAAETASRRFDQAEAERLVDESIALLETAAARLTKARIELLRRRYPEARVDADRAFALGAGAPAREVAAWAAHYLRRIDEAIALADDGASIAHTDEDRAACMLIGGWASQALGDFAGAETRLETARRRSTGSARTQAGVFLGSLRVNQGRVDEGLRLLSEQPDPSEALHGYPLLHGLMFRAMALADRGRAAEALVEAEELATQVERAGAERWIGRSDNLRGWVLRNLGARTEADESNERAAEATAALELIEPLSHAHLDLACGAVFDRDLDRAERHLAAATQVDREVHAMQWRHRLRRRLLIGRRALLTGDPDPALELGSGIVREADERGMDRYRVLGRVLVEQAHAVAGQPVDVEQLGELLTRLADVAGLEAWWITADVAAITKNDRFHALAEQRVTELAACAGDRAEVLHQTAARYLS
jgi:DNA-binding SARP family transcriptional activator/tetratricopeptide (TPR) repeat protein